MTKYDLEKIPKQFQVTIDCPQFEYYYQDLIKNGNEKEFFYMNYKCLIRRNVSMGHLCGYVFIDKYIDVSKIKHIHGDITWGDHEKVGFDCAHLSTDFVPLINYSTKSVYKDFDFVESELKKLVNQLTQKDKVE